MTTSLKRLLLSTALTIPAMAGPAFAQTSDQPCDELSSMIEEGIPQDVSMTEEDLRSVVEDGEAEACETRLTQLEEAMSEDGTDQANAGDSEQTSSEAQIAEREQTTVEIDEERVVEGIVRLQREAPQVDVEQGEAQVTVRGGNPEVSVEQAQPEITVRQPQATVTMEMQQPTVTIDQPAPEIIITMPDPTVNVANAEPQVEVQQAEPTVSVSQAPPQVNLDLRVVDSAEASGDGVQVEDEQSGTSYAEGEAQEAQSLDDAQVNVTQAEPKVTYQQATNSGDDEGSSEGSNAQVNVTSAGQPTVNYESSEPQVNFSMAGEPQIQFNQTGEPTVTMQTAQAGDAAEQSGGDQQQTSNGQQQSGGDQQMAEDNSSDMQSGEQQSASDQSSGTDSTGQQTADAQSSEAQSDEQQMTGSQASGEQSGEQQNAEGNSSDMQSSDQQTADAGSSGSGLDMEVDGYEAVAASEVSNDMLADTALYSQNNERIGDIEEVVAGDGSGLERIVVGVGGFLGLGERQVALDLDEMQVMQATEGDDVRVYTDMTREELENMERYDG